VFGQLAKRSKIDRLLVSAIDEALTYPGESVKQSIYFHIEKQFKVARNEIPENLEEFQVGLEKIFAASACFIEIQIMKNLHKKIGLPLKMESEKFGFVDYVDVAKKGFLRMAN
jgi:hypothetical protein